MLFLSENFPRFNRKRSRKNFGFGVRNFGRISGLKKSFIVSLLSILILAMDYHIELRSIEKWQCSYCQSENVTFDLYCRQCNTQRNTQIAEFNPNPGPNEYPHYEYTKPVAPYPYNPEYTPMDENSTQHKETFDGKL